MNLISACMNPDLESLDLHVTNTVKCQQINTFYHVYKHVSGSTNSFVAKSYLLATVVN